MNRKSSESGRTAFGGFAPRDDKLYFAFFKPYGVLTQFTRDEGSDKTTLAEFGFPPDVYPIGRLDYDSEGLLLLSDDPALNSALLDPTRGHRRTYLVQVENIPQMGALEQLAEGMVLEGRQTAPAEAYLLRQEPELPPRPVPVRFRKNIPTAWIELTLTEGKNRQVRKMTAAVGHPTLRLMRVAIGDLEVFDLDLEPGQWIELSHEQLMAAFE